MNDSREELLRGEGLVKQDLITMEELKAAREREAETGTPWLKVLLQQRKISFETLEKVLRYEFHTRTGRSEQFSLGDALLETELITREQLNDALDEQKTSGRLLGNILLEKQLVTREGIAKALARQFGMEYVSIEETYSEVDALNAVPENIAIRNAMVPVACENDRLMVLINSPQARERLKDLGVLLGKEIHAMLTSCEDIEAEIVARYQALKDGKIEEMAALPLQAWSTGQPPVSSSEAAEKGEVLSSPQNPADGAAESNARRFHEIAQAAAGATVVQMVSTIIEGAVNSGATDIHIDPHDPESRVRYRIDGILHDVMSIPQHQHPAVVSRIKIIADLDITETRHPQDGHISITLGKKEYDVRVATLPTYLGERVVLRLLDQTTVLSGLKDLGLSADNEIKMRHIISQPYGMILVTGPTGSGKTTTLYAALNQKDALTESIVTLEDPVEYQLPGINQVQIDPDINLTFASTLRAALRQDIDVLLVGEIRDPETAQIAIRAAMTGHLVFSTLHTNDAIEAISTLRNMGVPPFLIAAALTAVIGQRLVRKMCSHCRKPFKPEIGLLTSLGLPANTKKLYRSTGCPICHFTGHSGRTGVFEVLEITPEIREEIINEASADKISKMAGYQTLASHCLQKVLEGSVNPEEYLRVIRI